MTISPGLKNRRLTLLKTEVNIDFDGLVPALEAGCQVVLVTAEQPDPNLNPDVLRRIGGMIALCRHYGAAVVFVSEGRFLELNNKGPSAS